MATGWHRRVGVLLFVAASMSASQGCFRSPDVSRMVCTDSEYCPLGYRCAVLGTSEAGSCIPVSDAGELDSVAAGEVGGLGDPHSWDAVEATDAPGGVAGPLDSLGDRIAERPLWSDASTIDSAAVVDVQTSDTTPDIAAAPDAPVGGADVSTDVAGQDAQDSGRKVKFQGEVCSEGTECASTYCVDGFCCDRSCDGQCQSCGEQNNLGTCITVTGTPRGVRQPCAAMDVACVGRCMGSSATQCGYPAGETTCGSATCSSDFVVNPAPVCSGSGTCIAGGVSSCPAGKFCRNGTCIAQLVDGSPCSASAQCLHATCANGFCCPSGLTWCGTSCVSLSSSDSNCGACGRACSSGSTCSGGACYLLDGQACTTGTQCLSAACTIFYQDWDSNLCGRADEAVNLCGMTVPSGYISNKCP